jgi:hypothetical protein
MGVTTDSAEWGGAGRRPSIDWQANRKPPRCVNSRGRDRFPKEEPMSDTVTPERVG